MPKWHPEGDNLSFKRRKNAHFNRKILVLTKNVKSCECILLRKFICVPSLQMLIQISAKFIFLIKTFACSPISHLNISMHDVFIYKLLTTLMLKNVLNMEFFLEQKISSYLLSHQSSWGRSKTQRLANDITLWCVYTETKARIVPVPRSRTM